MKTGLIIGNGEVGNAHWKILSRKYSHIFVKDKEKTLINRYNKKIKEIDIMFIALQHDDKFNDIIHTYISEYCPKYVNILTTVPCGTTDNLAKNHSNIKFSHSTTRGLHPNLEKGLLTITKHIGGEGSENIKYFLEEAGFNCIAHKQSKTTELAHILNNSAYGINIAFAKEMADICRHYGVDYQEAVIRYTMTNNEGYEKLDHKSKCRPILTPPDKIGGHCVIMSANLIPTDVRGKLLNSLAGWNE